MCLKEDCNIIELGWGYNKGNKKYFTRKHYFNISDKNEILKAINNNNNTDVFTSAYLYDNKDISKSNLYGDLYFDFDCKDDFEKVRKDVLKALAYINVVFRINEDSVYIYYSGNKGVHITIPAYYFNIKPCSNLNGVFKEIIINIKKYTEYKTLDTQIYDNKRLYRIPNSINGKSGLYKIQLTANEIKNLDYKDILELAKKPRAFHINNDFDSKVCTSRFKEVSKQFKEKANRNKNISYKSKIKVIPPCIKEILMQGAKEGSRNNTIAVLASFYKSAGKDLNTALKQISMWNLDKNSPPTKESELTNTIKSIYYSKASYGCTTIKELIDCNCSDCNLKNRRN